MVKTFQVYLDFDYHQTPHCSSDASSTTDTSNAQLSSSANYPSRTYSCMHCRAHLARQEDLVSKSFYGSQGQAYLFNRVVNVNQGEGEKRLLLTGMHLVADIECAGCFTVIGWKYERAFQPSQKYKEGKYIVELAHLIKDNGWITS